MTESKKGCKKSQHFPKTNQECFEHLFLLLTAIQPFLKCNNFYKAQSLVSIFCVFTTVVNIIYILCCLPRALITLTGSFNWINYPQTAICDSHSQTKTQTKSFLIRFPACSYQSAICQWHYILMNVNQLVLPEPFNTEGGAPSHTEELLLSCCCYPSIWNRCRFLKESYNL